MKRYLLFLFLIPTLIWAQNQDPAVTDAYVSPDPVSYPGNSKFGFKIGNTGSETATTVHDDQLQVGITFSKASLASYDDPLDAISGSGKNLFQWVYFRSPNGNHIVTGILVEDIPAGRTFDVEFQMVISDYSSSNDIGLMVNLRPSFAAISNGNNPVNDQTSAFVGIDTDGDLISDADDLDDDNDGILDHLDGEQDTDGDGLPNRMDIDSDGDGIPDTVEVQATASFVLGSKADSDFNGVDDNFEEHQDNFSNPVDTDGDGTPDFLDTDSDGDGVEDSVEGFDFDGDGEADKIKMHVDVDWDGLDNGFEGSDSDDGYIAHDEITDPLQHLAKTEGSTELMFREVKEEEGSGEVEEPTQPAIVKSTSDKINNVKVYPSPATAGGEVAITWIDDETQNMAAFDHDRWVYLSLYTVDGQFIKKEQVRLEEGNPHVNMSLPSVPDGIYIVKLVSFNKTKSQTIVIKND